MEVIDKEELLRAEEGEAEYAEVDDGVLVMEYDDILGLNDDTIGFGNLQERINDAKMLKALLCVNKHEVIQSDSPDLVTCEALLAMIHGAMSGRYIRKECHSDQ